MEKGLVKIWGTTVLMNEFEMTDLGNTLYFLGMEILYSEKGIILHQLKYELELFDEI